MGNAHTEPTSPDPKNLPPSTYLQSSAGRGQRRTAEEQGCSRAGRRSFVLGVSSSFRRFGLS